MQQSYIISNPPQYINRNLSTPYNQAYMPVTLRVIPERAPTNQNYYLINSQITENKIPQHVNTNNWNLNQNNQTNLKDFPFGRERAEMYNYVADQFKESVDQQNKRILQKFRLDAIKHRNQRVMKHFGKIPYVTESMMPGSVDASKLIQRQQTMPVQRVQRMIPVKVQQPIDKYISIPMTLPVVHQQPKPKFPFVKAPRKLPQQSISIGISANFQKEFPLKKKKRRKYYTIQQQQQQEAMNKIETMLHQINVKLKKNTDLISQSFSQLQNQSLSSSLIMPQKLEKQTIKHRKYFEDNNQKYQTLAPRVKYSVDQLPSKNRSKTQNGTQKNSQSLKNHLRLLKKDRRRLQDLDQYIYR